MYDENRDDWDGQDYTDWIDELHCADYWYPNEVFEEFDPNDDPMCGFDEEEVDDE
jgi:hypothetical protein